MNFEQDIPKKLRKTEEEPAADVSAQEPKETEASPSKKAPVAHAPKVTTE